MDYYYYNKNYLLESDHFTSLKISEGHNRTITLDSNNRQIVVTVLPKSKNKDLYFIPGITVVDGDEEVKLGVFQLRRDKFIINGMRFYFYDGIDRFSQQFNTEVPTTVIVSENHYFISINTENIPETFEDYQKLVLEEKSAYVKQINKSKFYLSNYYNQLINRYEIRESKDQSSTDFSENYVTAVDIQHGFMEWIRKLYPDIEVGPELSDLTSIKQKTGGYICVINGMYQTGTEFSVHPHSHTEFGKYMVVTIPTEMEYLTDDIIKYNQFRDRFYFEKKLFGTNKFTFSDRAGNVWNAQAIFNYASDARLDRAPASRYLSESNLYSFKFSCDLSGYLLEKYEEFPKLKRIIINWREGISEKIIKTFTIDK